MTGALRDLYEVLQVPRTATGDEIKRAYRRLATKLHPDRNPGDATAEERFKEATAAYEVLSDPERRARYDRFGFDAVRGRGFDGGSATNPFEVADFSDLFEGIFGEIFRGGRSRRAREQGRDVDVDVEVGFEDSAFGCHHEIEVERLVPCEPCAGSGSRPGTRPATCDACGGAGEVRFRQGIFSLRRACSRCMGSGRIVTDPCPTCVGQGQRRVRQNVPVEISPGIESGEVLTLSDLGHVAPNGRSFGRLLVRVRVREHPFFVRKGDDVHCSVPIGFPTAALGSMVDVPTLDGTVKMRVPAGTQSGHVFRLRGKGIVRRGRSRSRGDQLVTIHVEVPQKLTRKQRELVETLSRELGEEVHPQRRTFLEKLRGLFDG